MRIATGEEDEAPTSDGKNAAEVSLGKRGGKARGDTKEGSGKAMGDRLGRAGDSRWWS